MTHFPIISVSWLCAALVVAVAAEQGAAAPFPASQWQYRSTIGLNNAVGTEDLADFPVLVKLNSGNFDFSKAKADGSDLRFADANNAPLSYEIEKWDSGAQQAAVWVKAPQIDMNSDDDYFHMLYGNPGASDAQDAPGVWSNGYVGVWHMTGTGTTEGSLEPSSTGSFDGTVQINSGGSVTSVDGAIGPARNFDTTSSHISVPQGPGLNEGDEITVSYWLNATNAQPDSCCTRVLAKKGGGVGWETQRGGGGTGGDQYVRVDTNLGINQYWLVANGLFDDTWHMNTFKIQSGQMDGFMDGGNKITNTYNHGDGFGNSGNLLIANGGGRPVTGAIDEVRFSNVIRSDQWINAEYRSQTGSLAGMGTIVDRQSDARTGLIAQYTHEDPTDRLRDMTGHGHDATNHGGAGGVQFVAAPDGEGFVLGDTVGSYNRPDNKYLELPPDVVELGESFTFTALVRRDGNPNTGYQTILGTNRFRFQWSADGREADKGRLRLDITGTGDALTAPGVFDLEKWYFVALRYDAATNTGDAFLETSNSLGTPAFSFTPGDPLDDLMQFRIGADGLSGIGSFDGWTGFIDGARFYGSYLDDPALEGVLQSYVPEPSALLLLVLGTAGLGLMRRLRGTCRG
jgi:hypothetical protein